MDAKSRRGRSANSEKTSANPDSVVSYDLQQLETTVRRTLLLFLAWSVPFVLLVLKVIEVFTEPGHGTAPEALGVGILRRVDDASFWVTVFIAVGCLRIFGALQRLESMSQRRPRWRFEQVAIYFVGALIAAFFVLVFVFQALAEVGTRFPWAKWWVHWFEGMFVCLSVFVSGVFLTLCFQAAEDIRWLVMKYDLRDRRSRSRIREAELLLNGCLAPIQLTAAGLFLILAVLAAIAVAGYHTEFKGWCQAHLDPTEPTLAIGMLCLGILPSLFVAAWMRFRWNGWIRWSLGPGFLKRPLWVRCVVESNEFGR